MSPRFGSRGPIRPRPGGSRPPARRQGAQVEERRSPGPRVIRPENLHIEIPARLTVKQLADMMRVQSGEVIKVLLTNGMLVTINQPIDYDTAAVVAHDLGFQPREAQAPTLESTALGTTPQEEPASLQSRPPVITIMGHVDHGKTSLLDAIRQANVVGGEAGGITQHIGAYQIEHLHGGRQSKITFLDTPGHEAFTQMRARGVKATDIAVLVVAADDGVQPQTIEAIGHARAGKVPLIVAINKVDLPNANPDRVKQQLAEHEVVAEEYGGDTPMVAVSARTRQGIDDLLEVMELVAEIQELKANPDRPARGVVIEAQLDRTRGPVATLLVQTGTLNVGDIIAVGPHVGRVRAMFDDRSRKLRHAEPSLPVEILGLSDVPQAGDRFGVAPDEKTARVWAQEQVHIRQAAGSGDSASPRQTMSIEELLNQAQAGATKELNVIIKCDVQGSVEPIRSSVDKLSTDEVRVKVLLAGVGNVTETDVNLAVASRALIVAFNVRTEPGARRVSETRQVEIRSYSVIYEIVDDIASALRGMLEPKYRDVLEGRVEVRQLFRVGRERVIAGSHVSEGRITRQSTVTVLRGGKSLIEHAKLANLRRFKDDAREVLAGYECGITVEGFNDFQVGDIVEAYARERIEE
ncbi:MAG: translation initiation factor IF-2 [Chloroflexota bacterium]|nr:MAG: translation initiation factor IF-2 [Chloroflexota bacterium]